MCMDINVCVYVVKGRKHFPDDLWKIQVQVCDLCSIQGHLWEATEAER